MDKPSLKKFRLLEGDLGEKETEHNQYAGELNTVLKYYTESSEIGKRF